MSTVTAKTRDMVSYGVGKFQSEFFNQAFGVLAFLYYETEVNLDLGLTALALIIYSLWNAINDPLIGFLTEKRANPFADKYGRRFPWILVGLFFWVFSFILIFAIPDQVVADQFLLFLWMVLSLCIFDTLYSLWDVNYQSIFPDKFRSESSRSKAAGIATGIGIIGIAAGFILPTVFVEYSMPNTFVTNSIIFAAIGFFLIFFLLPGVSESSDMIKRYLEDRRTSKSSSFLKELKEAFNKRNFVAWIVLYFFYQAAVVSMTGSVHYLGKYILPEGTAGGTTIIFVALLVGALLGLPLWINFAKRSGSNQKTLMITATLMAVFALPIGLPMVETATLISFFIFFFGIAFGGYWMIMTPALADVIDELVIESGHRNDGIYMGFRAFFGRLAFAVQALSFWFIHIITDFDPTLDTNTMPDLAKLGIHIHMAIVPVILLIIGVLVFWRINTLNPEIVRRNKEKLKEMNL
ncbi:MAG: MFS transporter [Candidatus Kariarchaeaceae archaeon]|jgi:GPH family glycoside/pentoside/hexuronide:cation symporter